MPDGISLSPAALGLIGALSLACVALVALLYRQMLGGHAQTVARLVTAHLEASTDLKRERDSYRSMASDAVNGLETVVEMIRAERGLPATEVVAPVKPFHNSPITASQQEAADLATLQARLAAANRALHLTPKVEDQT